MDGERRVAIKAGTLVAAKRIVRTDRAARLRHPVVTGLSHGIHTLSLTPTDIESLRHADPKNLVRMNTNTVADVMEKDAKDVEDMLRELNFTVKNGVVTHHPDACRCVPETHASLSQVKIVRECA